MAKRVKREPNAGARQAPGEATRARVREIVAAIAADVIAETAGRLGPAPRREAAALRMSAGTRSARVPRRKA
jgi:hypothetical protein